MKLLRRRVPPPTVTMRETYEWLLLRHGAHAAKVLGWLLVAEGLRECAERNSWDELDLRAAQEMVDRLRRRHEDGLVEITVRTRKPGKWRFLDTETGETWRWESGEFRRAEEDVSEIRS